MKSSWKRINRPYQVICPHLNLQVGVILLQRIGQPMPSPLLPVGRALERATEQLTRRGRGAERSRGAHAAERLHNEFVPPGICAIC